MSSSTHEEPKETTPQEQREDKPVPLTTQTQPKFEFKVDPALAQHWVAAQEQASQQAKTNTPLETGVFVFGSTNSPPSNESERKKVVPTKTLESKPKQPNQDFKPKPSKPLEYQDVRHLPSVQRYYDELLEVCIAELITGVKDPKQPICPRECYECKEEISTRAFGAARNSFNAFLFDWGNSAAYRQNSELNPVEQDNFTKRYKIVCNKVTPERKKELQRTKEYLSGVQRWRTRKPQSSTSVEQKTPSKTKKEPKKAEQPKKSEPKKEKSEKEKEKPVVPKATPASEAPKVVAPKKVADKKNYPDISAWAKDLRPSVCKADSQAIAYAKMNGIEFRQVDNTMNQHSISAMERHQAMRGFLQIVGRGKVNLDICSYFGSNRDLKFVPKDDSNLKISWTCCPDDPIQGDNAREFSNRIEMPGDKLFDVVVFVDVYQSGPTHLDVLDTPVIKRLISKTTTGHVYGILRKFHGLAGADVFHIKEESKTYHKVEGVWIEKDKLIYFSPDSGGSSYPGHPNPTWLTKRHKDGVDIHEVQNYGPYSLFKFALSAFNAQTIDDNYLIEPRVSNMTISKEIVGEAQGNMVSTIMNGIRSICPSFLAAYLPEAVKVSVMVHTQTVTSLATEYAVKKIVGLTLDTVITKVRASIDTDPVMVAVKTRFPNFVSELVTQTSLAVLYESKRSISERFLLGRQITADVEDTVDILRQPKIEKSSLGPKIVGLVSLLAFGLLVKKLAIQRIAAAKGDFAETVTRYYLIFRGMVNVLKSFIVNSLSSPFVVRTVVEEINGENIRSAYLDVAPKMNDWPIAKSLMEGKLISPTRLNPWHAVYVCLIAPFLEEILKQYFPKIAFGMFGLELFANASLFGTFNACLIGLMHVVSYFIGKKSYLGAMFLHGLTNFISLYAAAVYEYHPRNLNGRAAMRLLDFLRASKPTGSFVSIAYTYLTTRPYDSTPFEKFVENYDSRLPIDTTPCVSAIPFGTSLKPLESTMYPTTVARGFMKIWMHGVEMEVEQVKEILSGDSYETKLSHAIHPLLINNGIMYTPSNSMNNLLSCLIYRIHKDPFVDCPEPSERWNNWRELMQSPLVSQFLVYFKSLDSHEFTGYPTIEEIVKIMGQKGRRIEVCNKRLMEGEEMPPSKSYNVKWNETIPLRELSPGVFDIKPRAICNLDPSLITLTTQMARYITTTCHLIFDGQNEFHTIYGSLKICFASGYTQYQLSQMHTIMLESENFLAVAGDDSVFKVNHHGEPDYGESDFSMFDQSQDDGPNRIAFALWMKRIGIESDVIDGLIWIFAKGYKIPARNARVMSIVGSGGLQLPTGHTLTTVLNSLNNIWCYMSAWQTKTFDFPDSARSLGFSAKMRFYGGDYKPLSFLKGWWLPTDIGYVWMPLPSAVVKVGKFLKPLSYFTKKTGHEAISVCSAMIVNSYFGVDRAYPIFGDFLKTLDRFKSDFKFDSQEVNENEFKPRLLFENYKLDRDAAEMLMMQRYDFDYCVFQEIAELYKQIVHLPAYIQHPAFQKMKEVDYM